MPTRRQYLGLLAGLAGATAGCGAPGQEAATTTTTTTDARTTSGGAGTSAESDDRRAQSRYASVYEESIDSIAYIQATRGGGNASGSGFVYDSGHVVTNHHVVADASSVSVRFNRGEWFDVEVQGTDPYSDLAVLAVDGPEYATALPRVEEEPEIGTEVVAIGHPFGLDRSATQGIISGVNRNIPAPERTFQIADGIQTDAAVNPGNSGGPLVTLDGEVAGVVSSGGGENIAFAISVALMERVVPALIESGSYTHPYMGVTLATVTPTIARYNDLEAARGVIVNRVLDDGPAAGSLQPSDETEYANGRPIPVGGDVIVALDGEGVEVLNDLSSYLALHTSPGDDLAVTVLRDDERTTVTMEVGSRPPPGAVQPSRAPATET